MGENLPLPTRLGFFIQSQSTPLVGDNLGSLSPKTRHHTPPGWLQVPTGFILLHLGNRKLPGD